MEQFKFTRNWARAAMLLLTMLLSLSGVRAEVVTIGDGTATSNTNPIGTYYNYSITEQLYTAEEIGMAGTINSISFYYMGIAAKDLPITVYMKTVDAEDLSTGISLADAEEVFSGTLSVTTTAGWVTIDLDTPFAYDGKSNLLIGIYKDYLYYFSGQSWQGTATSSTMARYTQSDSGGPYTTSTVPGTAQTNRPNIQIDITPGGGGPVCEKPTEIAVDNITKNSATVTWEDESGEMWNLQYKASSATEWTEVNGLDRTSYELSGLLPNTLYSVRVQTDCGSGNTSVWKSASFPTPVGLPFVEEFGTSIPTGWAQYAGLMDGVLDESAELTSSTYGWSFGTANGVFDNHARVNIYGTSCNKWLVTPTIPMENNVQLTFDVALTAYSGTGAAPAQGGTDDKFVVLAHIDKGWYVLRQWDNAGSEYVYNNLNATPTTVSIDLSEFAGENVTIAFYGESTEENADNNLHIDNVSVDYIPACPKPTGLAVNYESGVTATLTWEGNADAYNIDVNGTVIEGVTSPYELENLELATAYEVKVQAACSATEQSEWSKSVSFTTDMCMPADQCAINYELADSYGDGWGGAAINVVDVLTGEVLASLTFASGYSASGTLNVCKDREIQFVWVTGGYSGNYDYECSYVVTDLNDDVIFEGSGAMAEPVNFTVDCTTTDYRTPTGLAASEIGPHSAVLSWTENSLTDVDEWVIAIKTPDEDEYRNEVDADSNPFTLEDLDPETTYTVKVRPITTDGTIKWSAEYSFTTAIANPAPTNLTVTNVGPTSATVSWDGFADNGYAVEYAEGSFGGAWLQYDDDTYSGGIGNSSATTWTWGVMYPGNMVMGNKLTKVSIYETSDYNTADITINIYSGGDNAPGTLLYTETVTPNAADAFHEITLATPVDITPGENLWITLTEYGQYVLTYCASDEPNNNWVDNGGTWAHVSDLSSSLAGDGWMIRGYISSAQDPSTATWIPVSNPTSPLTIEDLDPETLYTVRVKALYSTEEDSEWAMAAFTTLKDNPVPTDLDADLVADGATLTWTGYGDSYNVQYRTAADFVERYFFEGFEDGIPSTWTTIDADGDGNNWLALSEIPYTYAYYASVDLSNWAHSGYDAATSPSYVNNVGSFSSDHYLISPLVDLKGTLRFYAASEYSDKDSYEVLLSTTGTDVANFTVTLQEMQEAPYGSWDEVLIDLSAYAGQQGYIAIHHVSSDKYFLVIDDFGIYEPIEAGPWTDLAVNGTTATISGLDTNTAYEYRVQSIKDGDESDWSEVGEFALVTLFDATENSYTVDRFNGMKAHVTLYGRTLFQDGAWNTLTLPFNYDLTADDNVLEGAVVRTLDGAEYDADLNKLSLTFTDDQDEIEAGKPYLIKWTGGSDIDNPQFSNVIIDNTDNSFGYYANSDHSAAILMNGTYDLVRFTEDNQSILFLGDANTLYWPQAGAYVGACRAYFELYGFTAGESAGIRFALDFGEESGTTTGIVSVEQPKANGEWYDLNGRKLDNQPTRKGVYIMNGKKVVIK